VLVERSGRLLGLYGQLGPIARAITNTTAATAIAFGLLLMAVPPWRRVWIETAQAWT
jgi:hypothetical protein